jgi:multiple antibiotic resistance protein
MRTVALAAGESFAALFPVVDPIGNASTFAALTAHRSNRERRSEARRSVIAMVAILLIFLVTGEPLLRFFGISLEGLQIAAGIVIAAYGFRMVMWIGFPPSVQGDQDGSIAFTPMAMPLLAGPGAMGIVMGLEARDSGSLVIPGFVVGIVVLATLTYVCFRLGDRVTRLLGKGGLEAVVRTMGLLVLAIGVELIVHGIVEHGAVTSLHAPG